MHLPGGGIARNVVACPAGRNFFLLSLDFVFPLTHCRFKWEHWECSNCGVRLIYTSTETDTSDLANQATLKVTGSIQNPKDLTKGPTVNFSCHSISPTSGNDHRRFKDIPWLIAVENTQESYAARRP